MITPEMAEIRERERAEWSVPEGCELVAVEHEGWRPVTGKLCRRQRAGRNYCRAPAVAELDRGRIASYSKPDLRRVPNWWAYCPEHMYGNWIEDGKVMHWILREKRPDA